MAQPGAPPAAWRGLIEDRNQIQPSPLIVGEIVYGEAGPPLSGQVRGVPVGCFVRVSIVRNLQLVEPEAYFRQTDEVGFGKLNSIATPDIRIHLFDFSYLGGRKARRIVYSGTDDGVKVGNLVHQTLDGNRIVTLTCFAEQQRFQLVYNELEAVAASLRFLK